MRAGPLSFLLLAVCGSPALAQETGVDEAQFEIAGAFFSPSHNIYCSYYSAGGEPGEPEHDRGSEMHCVRLGPSLLTVTLKGDGKLIIDRNPKKADVDPPYAEPNQVLAYGQSEAHGSHICASAKDGITCTVKGKGFTLSKAGVKQVK
jgi:hypothetical protein